MFHWALSTLFPFVPQDVRIEIAKGGSHALDEIERWAVKTFPKEGTPPGTGERFYVVFFFKGMQGSHAVLSTEQPDRCPGVYVGTDWMVGTVERRTVSTESEGKVEYSGVLERATDLGLCGVQQTADGDRWCSGRLKGSGPVEVKIELPGDQDLDDMSVLIQPQPSAKATVTGNCGSLDNPALERDYRSHDTLLFNLGRDRALKKALRPGVYKQESDEELWAEGATTLAVGRVEAPPARPAK
jgi:hypothetical protein